MVGGGVASEGRRCSIGSGDVRVVGLENREQLDVKPSSISPPLLTGHAFVPVSALLVDPAHRRIHRMSLDPVQAKLIEREAGADADGVAGESLPPGQRLADHDAPAGRPVRPLDLMQGDEPDVANSR